jgi:hypothetical protein
VPHRANPRTHPRPFDVEDLQVWTSLDRPIQDDDVLVAGRLLEQRRAVRGTGDEGEEAEGPTVLLEQGDDATWRKTRAPGEAELTEAVRCEGQQAVELVVGGGRVGEEDGGERWRQSAQGARSEGERGIGGAEDVEAAQARP